MYKKGLWFKLMKPAQSSASVTDGGILPAGLTSDGDVHINVQSNFVT